MGSKSKKQLQSETLGMPIASARSKLNKKILHSYLSLTKFNTCYRCNEPISSPEDLAIEHAENWLDSKESMNSFWDLTNIRFSHVDCNRRCSMIEITLVDKFGKEYPTYEKDGKTYIAGKDGKRYKIKIKNMGCKRVEAFITVDGRNVITGEEGDYITQTGYIISAFNSVEIDGFRQNMEEVAAFNFSSKEEGYSSKLGTPENSGVIGVAVFGEQQQYVTPIIPWPMYPYPKPKKTSPWVPSRDRMIWTTDTAGGLSNGYEVYGTSNPSAIQCSASHSADAQKGLLRSSSSLEMSAENMCETSSSLGTGYGDSIDSKVSYTSFTRERPNLPDEIVTLYYDTKENLKKRGIIQKKPVSPNPFPKTSPRKGKVEKGFAAPPPGQEKKYRYKLPKDRTSIEAEMINAFRDAEKDLVDVKLVKMNYNTHKVFKKHIKNSSFSDDMLWGATVEVDRSLDNEYFELS